jgi:hypothetical protein
MVMDSGFLTYGIVLVLTAILARLGRLLRIPPALLVLAAGAILGRPWLEVVDFSTLPELLPAVTLHLTLVLAALGLMLGRGLLRLPVPEVLRRSGAPVLLALAAFLAGTAFLPRLIPDLYPKLSFRHFLLPLSFVFAEFPLLAVRDLRGRPPADVGSVFLVATALIGAVISFAPKFLWAPVFDMGEMWRGPILVLGESGALGVAIAVIFLALTRALRGPRWLFGTIALVGLAFACLRFQLWAPFGGLGFGIILGRAGEPGLPVPFTDRGAPYSELPFAFLAAFCFAPDLWRGSLVLTSMLHAAWVTTILLIVRSRVPDGKRLVSGPGLLFLGLALAIRLDRRMGPLTRTTIDLALPAWIVARAALVLVRRRERVSPEPPRK